MICCTICHEVHERAPRKAKLLAPRYVGGDENGLVEFIPICMQCRKGWYADIPAGRRIHTIPLPESFHKKHPDHSLVTARYNDAEGPVAT